MTYRCNSDTAGHRAKAWPGNEEYKAMVAEPMMAAIDAMPAPYRQLIQQYGYVDVYRAWKRGLAPSVIQLRAEANGGVFVL